MDKYFLHPSSFVDENVSIGKGTKIWHFSHILKNVEIGENCTIGQNVVIGPNVKIGSNCKIQNNVSLYDGLYIEDNVFLGPSCVFTNVINPRSTVIRKDEFKETIIKHAASIGANATIVRGNNLEEFCMVGAGAVVTKSIKNNSLVIGNPAKHHKWISDNGHILDEKLICPETKQKYELDNGVLVKR